MQTFYNILAFCTFVAILIGANMLFGKIAKGNARSLALGALAKLGYKNVRITKLWNSPSSSRRFVEIEFKARPPAANGSEQNVRKFTGRIQGGNLQFDPI